MTKQEVSQVVFMLFAGFPQAHGKDSDERLRVYADMLQDLDFAAARAAVARLLQSSRFLPTIAEVREQAHQLTAGPKRTGLEAWGDVTRAIRYVGSYGVPDFDDPLVAHAVACLGWRELCLGDNEAALRARFIEAYECMADREGREAALSEPLRLSGTSRRALPRPEEKSAPRWRLERKTGAA
jgi:hypothetical protein